LGSRRHQRSWTGLGTSPTQLSKAELRPWASAGLLVAGLGLLSGPQVDLIDGGEFAGFKTGLLKMGFAGLLGFKLLGCCKAYGPSWTGISLGFKG